MKKQLVELGKTALILILCFTLLLLILAAVPVDMIRGNPALSRFLQPIAPLLGLPPAELAYVEDARPVSDAAKPLALSVSNSTGRQTIQWSFSALDDAYETLGGTLGEALDTVQPVSAATSHQLQKALAAPSICFDFGFLLPGQLLASWLDAAPEQPLPAGRLYVLALEREQVNLYLSGSGCYWAETQLDPAAFAILLEQFKDDGSHFAFETDSRLSSLTLLPGTEPKVSAAVSSNPCDKRYIETLAAALGFNPYDDTSYTDSSGVTRFSETNCSLQISAGGELLLTASGADRFAASGSSTDALVEQARALVEQAVGSVMGDARLYLSGITQTEDTSVCTFDYVLNGIPVSCGDGPAASVTFSGSAMTECRILIAGFTLGSESLTLLPHTQAAAILPSGGSLTLAYDRLSAGKLTAGWKNAVS